ncbi:MULTISPECIES: phage tail tape measure protein [Brenneria]|uniref:Phage tail tape measure protein n=1 Tax=Brenneria nigrifluens DSM 30175 = ATCC 13028 TaxID=1121120 RepID=A0A2U1UWI4_9GAMM|nr:MULTISPECIES: phage tail tape measure protein [Brenneria]EHD22652.1 phage tail tape measure protein, TP901 family [Brenneria sp. EniD312]PWC25982.1 phage tail tape measure protein [Brenneria nigrifluens DSM 30175 = ATCC 13028]QCR05634.1 phage tail tape measure protein [Brenneria nigrifluens DSM 30175 = ATCC 13028]
MATEFSIGVIIGGAVSGAFRSAIAGTRRTLDSLNETTRRLQERQTGLTQAMERYGHIGGTAARRMNSDLLRVGRTMEQLQRQQQRLSSISAKSDALRANRMSLYGKGVETYAMARTVAAPLVSSVTQYSRFESGLRDIAVTGNLNSEDEKTIGAAIRQSSLQTNQTQEAMLAGVNQLVADGMNANQASQLSGMLGKAATATKADMEDLAKMTFAFSDSLGISSPKEIAEAFAMAAAGAKTGSFEMKDMAKALPGLSKAFAARGITGKEAITQIISSLEAAKGAGSSEEAVTNMNNWLAAMGRSDTIQKYNKAGIDYQKSMSNYVSQGYSQYESSLMIANRFIDNKGKAFVTQWEAAGKVGDKEAQQKLFESFGMAEVFTDIQTVNHLVSMRQNWGKYESNKNEMNSPEAQKSLDTDFAKQNDTLEARWRRVGVGVADMALSIGESLRPTLVAWSDAIIPFLDAAGKWITANPEIVSTVAQVAAGLVAFKGATIVAKLGGNLLLSGFTDLWKGAVLVQSKFMLLRSALSVGGRLAGIANGVTSLTRALSSGLMSGLRLAGNGLAWLGRGAALLGRLLGGTLLRGITLVGRAVLILGRALMLNPIGLLITGIAVGAYLIYRYWGPISNWFRARWNDIRTAFSGGIGGVSRLIINWSPLGLFYKVFAGVMKYFGIDMPNKFTEFGGNIISGLVNGIRNRWQAAKASVSELGNNISGWFADKLGIHSPSRVFMGFGANIVQGAAIGISRTTPQAAQAGLQLARALIPTVPKISLPALPPLPSLRARTTAKALPEVPELPTGTENTVVGRRAGHQAGNASGGIRVTFSPNIYMDGKRSASTPEIANALNLSLHELEKMLERIMTQQQRRGYA